jgi:hypothetical protein
VVLLQVGDDVGGLVSQPKQDVAMLGADSLAKSTGVMSMRLYKSEQSERVIEIELRAEREATSKEKT